MNHDGRFERADSGTKSAVAGRGAAFGDLNNDGWMDVVMTVLGGRPMVFRNRGGNAHWLTISLTGTRSNRDGFGARLRVNGQAQYATSAGSYLSASDKRVHFGLGAAEKAKIEIVWPSGTHQTLDNVRADQFLDIREPERPVIATLLLALGLAWQTVSPEVVRHVQAGMEAQKQGRLNDAIVEFKKVTELAPDLPAAFVNLGAAYLQNHEYGAAIGPLKKSLELNPDLAGAQQMLGYALLAQGYAAESIPYLEHAHAQDALGIAQLKTGKAA